MVKKIEKQRGGGITAYMEEGRQARFPTCCGSSSTECTSG